jgi:hypothetical protein
MVSADEAPLNAVHLCHRFSREQSVVDLPSLAAAVRSAAHRAIEAVPIIATQRKQRSTPTPNTSVIEPAKLYS